MSTSVERKDRARAFVPELIPEPQDLDRTGPLDAREQRDLDRIHAARDNHQAAKWMRGKSLEAAFRRRLFRGDGTRTRQEYLDDEWDGISESAAYLEISEWRLAATIAEVCDRPAPDSHVRALIQVSKEKGCDLAANGYQELSTYAKERKLRITAKVVENLATYLSTGELPALELNTLFVPRQLPSATTKPEKKPDSGDGKFQKFGKSGPPDGERSPGSGSGDDGPWSLSPDQTSQITSWLVSESEVIGVSPDRVAHLLLQVLDGQPRLSMPIRQWMRSQIQE